MVQSSPKLPGTVYVIWLVSQNTHFTLQAPGNFSEKSLNQVLVWSCIKEYHLATTNSFNAANSPKSPDNSTVIWLKMVECTFHRMSTAKTSGKSCRTQFKNFQESSFGVRNSPESPDNSTVIWMKWSNIHFTVWAPRDLNEINLKYPCLMETLLGLY